MLKLLIRFANRKNWCLDYNCTTCGAYIFRSNIKRLFSREMLLEELKKLDADFLHDTSNREVMLLVLDEARDKDFESLLEEIRGTFAGKFLSDAIRIENERKNNHQKKMILEKHNKNIAERSLAQKNIWGAIRRKDKLAIDAIILKGIDLAAVNDEGLTVREALALM